MNCSRSIWAMYEIIEIFGELKIVFDIFLEDVYLFSSVETTYTPSGLCIC